MFQWKQGGIIFSNIYFAQVIFGMNLKRDFPTCEVRFRYLFPRWGFAWAYLQALDLQEMNPMSIFSIFSRKPAENSSTISSITDLSDEQKEEIEQMTDDGMKAADVAKALGIPNKIVYAYRKSMAYREQQQDPLEQAKHELAALKVQQEVLQLRAEMAQLRDEIEGSGDGEGDPSLEGLLMQIIAPKLSQLFSPQGGSPAAAPATPVAVMQQDPSPFQQPIELSDQEIHGLISLLPKGQRNLAVVLPDDKIKEKIK